MPETFKTTYYQLDGSFTAQKYFAEDHHHCHPRVLCIPTESIIQLIKDCGPAFSSTQDM